jgi:hypothetical protein
MCQIAGNLTNGECGFLKGNKYLHMNRDTRFSNAFLLTIEQSGV